MWIRRSSGIYFWNKPDAEKLEINGRAVGGIPQKLYIGTDPGDLHDKLEEQLNSNENLTSKMRETMTKLKNSITDNDNNYILYAKLKK